MGDNAYFKKIKRGRINRKKLKVENILSDKDKKKKKKKKKKTYQI